MTAIWDFVTGTFGTLSSLLTLLTPLFILISGIVSLFFGRKLFWVFVAAVGFLLGLYLADMLTPMLPEQVEPYKEFVRLAIALGAAGIALVVQKAGTILAGAFAVGLLAWWGSSQLEMTGAVQWGASIIAGLLGAVLLYFALDWMLLVLTALAGGMIAITGMEALEGIPVGTGPWLYVLLVVAGLLYQRREMAQDSRARASALPEPKKAPVTKAPVTKAPVTKAPVTKAPVTKTPRRMFIRRSKQAAAEAPADAAQAAPRPAGNAGSEALAAAVAPVVAPVLAAPVTHRGANGSVTNGKPQQGEIKAASKPAPAAVTPAPAAVSPAPAAQSPAPAAQSPAPAALTREEVAAAKPRSLVIPLPTLRMPHLRMPTIRMPHVSNPFKRSSQAHAGEPLPESELQPLEPADSSLIQYAPPAPGRATAPPPVGHIVYG